MSIGERIKNLRESNKISLEEFAKLLKIDVNEANKLEDGTSLPPYNLLGSMTDILNCSLDYLINGKEANSTIENMDSKKRIQYLLDYDDAEKFKKYNYVEAKYIFSVKSISDLRYNERTEALSIRERIYKEKKINIFNLCLDAFIC